MAKKTFGGLPPELRQQRSEPPTPAIDPLTGLPLSGGFGAGGSPLGGQPGMPGMPGMPGGRPGMGQPQAKMAPIYYERFWHSRYPTLDKVADRPTDPADRH